VWYLENGATHHMKKEHDLFSSLMERESRVHLELGDYPKYALKGEIHYFLS
jgi:hypothetical protein